MKIKPLRGIMMTLPLLGMSAYALGEAPVENTWQQRDGFSVSGGLYLPNYDTRIRKSSSSTTGSDISLEDDLGLDSDDEIPIFSIAYRAGSKHKFFFSYMSMDRDAEEILQEDLTFDGITFPAGAA